MPDWLPEPAKPYWERITKNLLDAGVPVERADSESIGMYALSVFEAQNAANLAEKAETDNARLDYLGRVARFGRDALQWGQAVGATPQSRARMGVTKRQPVKANPWADL